MLRTRPNIAELLEELPAADRPGQESKLTGPPPEVAERIAARILEGGRETIIELARMIRNATGDGEKNYKPGYALHCVALLAGRPGMEERRRLFTEAIASLLGGDEPPQEVQSFLVRELQVAGGPEVVETLGRLLRNADLCGHAALALTAIGERAREHFRKALSGAAGRPRLAIVQALGALGDRESVAALEEETAGPECDVRLAAVWALARAADPGAAGTVTALADRAHGWERIQATKACLLLAENLLAAGKKEAAVRICAHLRDTRTDPGERYVREAAEQALARAERVS